jgi:hypothetical protein
MILMTIAGEGAFGFPAGKGWPNAGGVGRLPDRYPPHRGRACARDPE